jgi:hypothetical protein
MNSNVKRSAQFKSFVLNCITLLYVKITVFATILPKLLFPEFEFTVVILQILYRILEVAIPRHALLLEFPAEAINNV